MKIYKGNTTIIQELKTNCSAKPALKKKKIIRITGIHKETFPCVLALNICF